MESLKRFARSAENVARSVVGTSNELFHRSTGRHRSLPDFIIIGTQKGGTSSLFSYLGQHPNVIPAIRKEVHFFDTGYERGVTWYRTHFPTRAYLTLRSAYTGSRYVTGEASPYYMFHPLAAERTANLVPDAKLIVMLRNPVTRAYSHYQHQVRKQRENLTFEQAIEAEPHRLAAARRSVLTADETAEAHAVFSYLSRGVYVDQLRVWLKFFSRDQIYIIKSETFFSDPQTAYNGVLKFLELSEFNLTGIRKHNAGSYKQTIQRSVAHKLNSYFQPSNQALYDLLGVDFGWESELN